MNKWIMYTAIALSAVACSQESEPSNATEAAPAASQTASNKPSYKVLSEITYAPFIMRNDRGEVSGFEHDLLNEIANRQGFTLTFDAYTWQGIFDALAAKKADIVSAGVTITEERKQKVAFTDPYFESEPALLVGNQSSIQRFADLKGKSVSLKKGTMSEILAEQFGAEKERRVYEETTWLTVKDVLANKVDAAAGDIGPLRYYEAQHKSEGVRVVTDSSLPKDAYGFVLRKDDTELLTKLNAGLAQVKADGTYERLRQKWFGGA